MAVLVAPVIVFIVYGVNPFFVQNGADPFLYTGYIANMPDLVQRFGYPYFAVRFGLLLPSEIFNEVLGPRLGYFAFRWLLAALGAGGLFILFRRIAGLPAAFLAVALFLTNPMLVHAMMTVYSDTVIVPYVTAGFALLLLPVGGTSLTIARLAAGALFGLAIHANLFAALPLGFALVAWLTVRLLHRPRSLRAGVIETGLVAAGIFVVSTVGFVYYGLRFGDANIVRPSIDAAKQFSGADFGFKAPTKEWLNFRAYLWLPVLAPVVLAVVRTVQRRRMVLYEVAAASMLLAAWVAYVVEEFLLNGYTFETYFYSSYLFGPTVIVLTLAGAALVEGQPWSKQALVASGFAVLLFPFVWSAWLRNVAVWALPSVPLVLLALIGLALVARHRPGARVFAILLICICPLLFTLSTPRNVPLAEGQPGRKEPSYDQALFNRNTNTLEIYELAQGFTQLMPKQDASPGSVVFWFPEGDGVASLAASTYLWHYNSLQVDGLGLPTLEEVERARLVGRTPRYLVLLSAYEELVSQGRDVVRALGLPHIGSETHVLRHGTAQLFVSIEEFVPAPCDGATHGQLVVWALEPPCP
jgi:hypothetical protein